MLKKPANLCRRNCNPSIHPWPISAAWGPRASTRRMSRRPRLKILEAQSPQVMKGNAISRRRRARRLLQHRHRRRLARRDHRDPVRLPHPLPRMAKGARQGRADQRSWRRPFDPPAVRRPTKRISTPCPTAIESKRPLPGILLIQNGAAWDRVLFQLTSTRLKASRKWMTAIRAETLPDRRQPVEAAAVLAGVDLARHRRDDKNDKGDWSTFVAERGEQLIDLDNR